MKWGPAIQRPKRKSEASVSACLRQAKSGTVSMQIAFSATLARQMHSAKKANVSRGLAEDADKLRVTFGERGNFGVTHVKLGGVRIQLPVPEGIDGDVLYPATRCEIIESDAVQVIFALPLREWAKMAKEARAA